MMIPLLNDRRWPLVGGVALMLTVLCSGAVGAQSSTASAKRDSVARADSVAKAKKKKQADDQAAAKKAADAKTAAAKSRGSAPTATKPASGASTAKPAGSGTTKPTGSSASGRAKSPAKPGAAAGEQGRARLIDDGPAIGVYVGASSAGLGFGTAPVVGVGVRLAALTSSLRLRGDLLGAHYRQTAIARAGAPLITEQASLTHVGAALSLVLNLSSRRSMRPYVVIGGGVFRFQASGQAGSNGAIVNGVFTSTTDVAGIGGVGLQLTPRFTVEARYLTVGDFHTLPITVGVRF